MSVKNASFEENMQRLEVIIEKMNGNVAIEEALALFEEADKLSQSCQKKLDEVQNKIEKILQSRQEGTLKVDLLEVQEVRE